MQINNLKVEYRKNPLGIDNLRPRLSWQIQSDDRNQHQTACRILVASEKKIINCDQGDFWDSGKINTDKSVNFAYQGKSLSSQKRYYWKVKVWDKNNSPSQFSSTGWWEMGLLKKNDWQAAWIGARTTEKGPNASIVNFLRDNFANSESLNKKISQKTPALYFRKTFSLKEGLTRARIYSTALGLYRVYVNGQKISRNLLTPGWTDYNFKLQYQTYDVTNYLQPGKNVVGIIAGDGWYAGNIAHVGPFQYGTAPALLVQLSIQYRNEQTEFIVSDNTWRVTTGPIIYSDLLLGMAYDACREIKNWLETNFEDNYWPKAVIKSGLFTGQLTAQQEPPIRTAELLKPKTIKKISSRSYLVDMGQNMVGNIKLKIRGKRGRMVALNYAERLDENGQLYTANLRSIKQQDLYIIAGNGEELFAPFFTYHGFRYIEITGYPGSLTVNKITGCVIYSMMEKTGHIKTSSSLINKIQENILWTQKGNSLSVPTDCPQRDERLGWLGDGQIFSKTASFNMNTVCLYEKWLADIALTQQPEGALCSTAPPVTGIPFGVPVWGDAAVIIPWIIYKIYGDKSIIQKNYSGMNRWMEYKVENSKNYIGPDYGFGDWLSLNDENRTSNPENDNYSGSTSKTLINTAYLAYTAHLMFRMSKFLNEPKKVSYYQDIHLKVKNAFNKSFVADNGRITDDTQTAYILALKFDLLTNKQRKLALGQLIKKLKQKKLHITTGIVGTGFLLSVLSENGYSDLAGRILKQKSYPSWGYMIEQNATTIWERWDGFTEQWGFQNPDMNSFNHCALGAVGSWFYEYLCGLRNADHSGGFKNIIIDPHPSAGITKAEGVFKSSYGTIKINWEKQKNDFLLSALIPVNTRARVYLPIKAHSRIYEGKKLLEKIKNINLSEQKKDKYIYHTGSGNYKFRVHNPERKL